MRVVFLGANFVPQGNNLSNQIREKDKGKSSWQTINFRGRLGGNPSNHVLSKNACVVSGRSTLVCSARVRKCRVGSCHFSLSVPAELKSVVLDCLAGISLIQSSLVYHCLLAK